MVSAPGRGRVTSELHPNRAHTTFMCLEWLGKLTTLNLLVLHESFFKMLSESAFLLLFLCYGRGWVRGSRCLSCLIEIEPTFRTGSQFPSSGLRPPSPPGEKAWSPRRESLDAIQVVEHHLNGRAAACFIRMTHK